MVFNLTASVVGGPAPQQPNWLKPDPKQPDTLGWREWVWDTAAKQLRSPSQGTLWTEAELVVPFWNDGDAVRGVSGVHAHLVPKHWKILPITGGCGRPGDPNHVHGIVERFGKYVLGTEGWRAEWVIIRELMAPSTEVGLQLEQRYPDVTIHYPEDEEDQSCTSVKSSKSGKGSRHTPRPRPNPLSSLLPPPTSSLASPQQIQMLANQSSALIASQNASPLSLSLGANQPSPSRSENTRRLDRFIYKWFWALAFGLVWLFFKLMEWL